MKDNVIRMAVCPLCGRTYHGAPAISREDNETLICPDCDDPSPHAGVIYTICSSDLCADYAPN